jgi:hypothetical protein
MEMIDHQQDANEKHSVYYKPLHPMIMIQNKRHDNQVV